jgi:hypothetical protein
MPDAASAAGEAFELLSSRYLCRVAGLRHTAAPFYTHLERGRWVQFDGLFSRRGGGRLVLEAKFHNLPVGLATPGIAARLTFAKEAGASGVILSSRCGFYRDIMRVRLPIEKVLLSWSGMRKGMAGQGRGLLTAALDPVLADERGFAAPSGARLFLGHAFDLSAGTEGFAFLNVSAERWLRRLAVSPRDVDMTRPRARRAFAGTLDIESAWAIEDSLRGFAPCDPVLLESALSVLSRAPNDLVGAWKALWRGGYRGRRGAVKNALDNLCVIGIAEKFRSAQGLFYQLRQTRGGRSDAFEILASAIDGWPAFAYFKSRVPSDERDKNAIAAGLSEGFAQFFPYARSLYNPAKVAGLMALGRYAGSAVSTASPS